jgi:hypothetical protein
MNKTAATIILMLVLLGTFVQIAISIEIKNQNPIERIMSKIRSREYKSNAERIFKTKLEALQFPSTKNNEKIHNNNRKINEAKEKLDEIIKKSRNAMARSSNSIEQQQEEQISSPFRGRRIIDEMAR